MKNLLIIFIVLCFFQVGYTQVRTKSDVKHPPTKTQNNTTSGAVGVSINLSSIFHSLKKHKNCNQVKIIFPKDKFNFKSDAKKPLTFRWKSTKSKNVKSYKVGLAILNGEEKTMLYQGDTYKTQFAWPKNVMWKSTKKEKVTYQFFVMALMKKGSKCKNVVESTKFTVITNNPIVVDNKTNLSIKNDSANNPKLKKQNRRPFDHIGNYKSKIDSTRKGHASSGGDIEVKRTGRNPQTGATIKGITNDDNSTKKELKKLADELVNLVGKENLHRHGSSKKAVRLKKLADELVNLVGKENLHHHGSSKKTVRLKMLADELVNLVAKENLYHQGSSKKTVRLKMLADELVNLAAKDSVGNISPNVKENLVKKKPSRTGRNPQTGATIKVQGFSKSDAGNALNVIDSKQQLKLINLFPKNNSNYKSLGEIKEFTWQLIGGNIPNPKYIIEIVKIGSKKQADITYSGETANARIYAKKVAKFKAGTASSNTVNRNANNNGSFGEGHYKWRVTETTTGISSNYSYFSISNCEINFTIANETIECLGYEGANRKFKICFDATYSSTSGNLTYLKPGSGLMVYDQNYAPISYSLVSPNQTLVTQNGATTSTVSYCFEVTVPSSVTSIGFGLQGDDLNLNPSFTCKPAANLDIDKLPSCICNDCDKIQTELTDIKITPKDSLGNQYNISTSLSLNVPIYGIEFQVQSYSYNSIPNSCSQGVNNIEQSGMILTSGTTVNGSTSLQLFNETISGSSTTNNHATKVVKYNSSTPLTGLIPVNLAIGLPGPLAGLNASCCKMSYQVCIKVIIYYDKDSSKSCVITKCFNFNNQ